MSNLIKNNAIVGDDWTLVALPPPAEDTVRKQAGKVVIFKVTGGIARRTRFLDALEKRGVLMVAYPHGQIRAVTHYGIGDEEISKTIAATAAALTETA